MRSIIFVAVMATALTWDARGAEPPPPLTDEQVAGIVASAPACPGLNGLDLRTRLIDFIDCRADPGARGLMDQGTSKVVKGPAGVYRATAPHRHAFFGYRIRSAGKDNPILIVFEYPDDADRNICFFTSESGLTGGVNADWSLETGVYCGTPLPLSNLMQYHTFIWWPQDEWPAVLVANWNRVGGAGAAARIWVFAIEGGLPKLDIPGVEAGGGRRLGHYNSRGYYLAQRLYFGLRSPRAVEHMLDYFDYVGVNELSWGVGHSDDATIPALGLAGTHLDEVLAAMDARGNFRFTVGLYLGDGMRLDGKPLQELTPDELREGLQRALDEFLERYGKYRSLKGIAFGAMYGIEPVADLLRRGIAADVVRHVRERRPDLEIATYVGGKALHDEYFARPGRTEGGAPTAHDVIFGWEASGRSWSDWLGDRALDGWRAWGQDPAQLRAAGFTLYEQMQPDDFRCFEFYGSAQNPRSMIYYDLDRSPRRSEHIGSPFAALWNTHYEGHIGLVKDYNFWHTKAWVAPDFNAPPPRALAAFASALALRDRQLIIPGSWNVRYFGHEADFRRFAKAFRALPAVEMKDAPTPVDTVKVRWAVADGRRHVSVLSLIPFASEVSIDGRAVSLPPYELVAISDNGTAAPTVVAVPCAEYQAWLEARLADFDRLSAEVRGLDPAAAPEAYARASAEARQHLAAGRLYAADLALGPGLVNELRLRKDLLARPELTAPRVASAPPMDGNLDAWLPAASDVRAVTGAELACHMYFPNSWSGPDDCSARLRLAHDGARLYVGLEVRDQKLVREKVKLYRGRNAGREVTHEDSCAFRLSTRAWRAWNAPEDENSRPELVWTIELPFEAESTRGQGRAGFEYVCRRTPTGYVVEGSAPLGQLLGVEPGGAIGFLAMIGDYDETIPPNLCDSAWAMKQVLMIPHQPNFLYYEDARNVGRLVLGK